MKKNRLLIFCILLLFSCKSRNATNKKENKNATTENENKPKDANKSVDDRIAFFEHVLIPPKFEQLKMTGKLDVETGSTIPTLNTIIYIENNQKIWMNLTAFFVSVARAIATPEGIKAKIPPEKTYIDSDFEYLNNLLNINFINYKSLEKLLMGRTFIRINDSDFRLTKNAEGYKMVSLVNQKIVSEDNKTREYKVELYYADNYDLMNVLVQDVTSADELEISYQNWQVFKNYRLPKNVKIMIKGTKTGQILLENTKFEDSKMETTYSVPKSYTKIEIK